MRKLLLLTGLVAGAMLAVQGCGTLFAPTGCTSTVFVIDSIKQFQGPDTVTHVDTLTKFKLCAQ